MRRLEDIQEEEIMDESEIEREIRAKGVQIEANSNEQERRKEEKRELEGLLDEFKAKVQN